MRCFLTRLYRSHPEDPTKEKKETNVFTGSRLKSVNSDFRLDVRNVWRVKQFLTVNVIKGSYGTMGNQKRFPTLRERLNVAVYKSEL